MRVSFLKGDSNLWKRHAPFLLPEHWERGVELKLDNGLYLAFVPCDGPTITPCLKPLEGCSGYAWWNSLGHLAPVNAEIKEVTDGGR